MISLTLVSLSENSFKSDDLCKVSKWDILWLVNILKWGRSISSQILTATHLPVYVASFDDVI